MRRLHLAVGLAGVLAFLIISASKNAAVLWDVVAIQRGPLACSRGLLAVDLLTSVPVAAEGDPASVWRPDRHVRETYRCH